MTFRQGFILAFLIINTITDIRKKEISLGSVFCFFVAGAVWIFRDEDLGWLEGCLGLIPGLILSAVSLPTDGAIGFGDGLLVAVIGFYLGIQAAAGTLLWGLLTCALCGVCLLILRRGNKKTALPFAPFLLIGFLIHMGGGG